MNESYQDVAFPPYKIFTNNFFLAPNLIAAIVVLILGWLIAIFLSKLVLKVLELLKLTPGKPAGSGALERVVGNFLPDLAPDNKMVLLPVVLSLPRKFWA